MSSVVAIVKSIVGQVFVVSPEGIRRVLVEGDKLFAGDQIDTGLSGAVSLELADGRTLDLGRDTQWSADAPDSGTDLAAATAQAAPSVEELQQAIIAGADPTKDLEATAAGPTASGSGGAAGGGHSFVMLDATAGRVDPTIGFPTAGINSAGQTTLEIPGGQTTNANVNANFNTNTDTDTDTDTPSESVLSLSATPTITEAGGVLVYTATLTQAPLSDLTVTLSNGAVIVIPAGSTTGTVNVPLAANDTVYNDATQIEVTVTGTSGGNGITVTTPTTPAVTQVTDTVDATTVTLTAGNTVTEGGQITYTATLTNPAQTPVTVTLSNGSVITIEAGQTSGSVNVPTAANDVYNNGSTVSTTITGTTGGNFENLVPNTTPAVTTITDSVDNTGLTLTATGNITEGGQITYTATLSNPAGTPMSVTLSNGSVITIEAGQTSGSVNVPTAANDVYNNGSTVSTTITGTTGGNFENLVPNTTPAVTTITDSVDNTGLTLTATGNITEGGQITYTATLSNPAGTPMTVTLSNGSVITIEAGQTSGSVNVPTAANDVYNNGSTVSTTITGTTGGNFENLVPNTTPAVTTITDSVDNTGLTLTATGNITEGGQITYTATLSNPAGTPMTVTLSNGSVITIEAGQTSGSVNVPTAANDVYNNGSTVSTTITGTTGGNFENLVPNTTPAVTTITDSVDNTGLTLTATGNITEGGQITYTATLSNPAGTPMTVTLSNGSVITIEAGQTSGSVNVPTAANDVYVNGSTVSTTITGTTGGNFENLVPNTTPAVTTITDSVDNTGLTLTATGNITEGGQITYTATLSNPAGTPMTVTLSNGSVITIEAGQTSGSVNVPTAANDVYNNGSTVSTTITGTTGGNFENLVPNTTPAVTTITDSVDNTGLTLTATGNITEGGQITYTATLSNPAGTPMTVTLSNGSVITIEAGQTSGSVNVPTAANDVYVNGSTVSTTITGTTGGNFENLVPNTTPAVTTITDSVDNTGLTLTATGNITEGGQITYTATLSNPAGTPMSVTLSNGSVITIEAGQTSGSVNVPTAANDVYNNGSTVSTTITGTTGGNFENLVPNTTPAVTTITDSVDTTGLTLTATGNITEGGQITYTATLSNPAGTPMSVTLSNGSVITIEAGQTSGSVNVPTAANDVYVNGSTVSTTITGTTGGNFENLVLNNTPAVTTVSDVNDTVTVTIESAGPVLENQAPTFTIKLDQKLDHDLTVTLSNGQTVVIAAGATQVGYALPAQGDDVYKDGGSASLGIADASVAGKTFENLVISGPASVAINDTVSEVIATLTADKSTVAEGGSVTYTVTLTNAAGLPLNNHGELTFTLSDGTKVTVPANGTSGSATITAADDVFSGGQAPIVNKLESVTGADNFEKLTLSQTAVDTTVTDEPSGQGDKVTVSIEGNGGVQENLAPTFTIKVDQKLDHDLKVTLSNGDTVTIEAGKLSAIYTAPVQGDDVYNDPSNLSLTVGSASVDGKAFENLVIDGTAANVAITDTVSEVIATLTADKSTVAEGGSVTYTVTLTNSAGLPINNHGPLEFTLSDGTKVTVPANGTSGSATIAAADDVFTGGQAPIVNKLESVSGADNFEKLTLSQTEVATTVTDEPSGQGDKVTVSIEGNGGVQENLAPTFTVKVDQKLDHDLKVTLSNGDTVTIEAGKLSAIYTAPVQGDDVYNDPSNLSLTVGSASVDGKAFENLVIDGTAANVAITDTVSEVIATLTADKSTVAEGGQVTYTVTLTNAAGLPINNHGPLEFTLSDGTKVTVPANGTSGSATIAAADDVFTGGQTPIVNKLESVTGADNFEKLTLSQTAVDTTVTDEPSGQGDKVTVSIEGNGGVQENLAPTFTIKVDQKLDHDLKVTLSNGDTVTIEAGKLSAIYTAPVQGDDVYNDPSNLSLTVGSASVDGKAFENLVIDGTAANVAITDTVSEVIATLTADKSTVAEGGSVTYTVTLTNSAGLPINNHGPLEFTLSDGTKVTVPANGTSGSATIAAADDVFTGGQAPIVNKLESVSGADNFEKLTLSQTEVATTVTDEPSGQDDKVTVSIEGNGGVQENLAPTFTVKVDQKLDHDLKVTLSNGDTVTIEAGKLSAIYTAPVQGDDVYNDPSNLSLTVGSASVDGKAFENLVIDGTAANVAITDTVSEVIATLTADKSTVAEGGQVTYTVTLTNAAGLPLNNHGELTFTLTDGTKITVPANTATGTATIAAADDVFTGGQAPIVNKLESVTGADNFEKLTLSQTEVATTVTDEPGSGTPTDNQGDKVTVSIASNGDVQENLAPTFTVKVDQKLDHDLKVTLSNGDTVTIEAGKLSAIYTAPVQGDDVYNDPSNLSLTVGSASVDGQTFENLVIDGTAANVAITDTVSEVIATLTADKSTVAEGGQVTYTVTLTNAAGLPLNNHGELTFTLTDGTKITVPANTATGTATIAAADDVFTGGQAPIVNKLESVTGADNFEKLTLSQTTVDTTVTDEPSGQGDKVTVSIEGNGDVQENLAPTFTVKVDQKLDHDLKVTLSNGDTVTIEAGKLSAIYTAPVQGDDVYNDPSNLSLTVGSASVDGQTFENLVIDGTAANVAITDTVSEVIATLTADKSTVAEGGQVTYTVTLTNAAGLPINNHGPLEFTLSDGTKITVAANTATGTATIAAADDVFTGGQVPIVNKLESVTGADNFEKLTLSQTEVATTVTDEPGSGTPTDNQGDKVTVSIASNGDVQENLAPTFTVKVDQKLDHDLKVTLSNGDTVTIEAGKLSAIYTAPVQGDDVYNDPSNLSLTVGSASVDGKAFENLVIDGTAANVAITDTVSEVIATLTADKSTVAEGGQVTYTVTLTNAAGLPINNHGPLEFTLSDGTKVTVPANGTSGSATIAAADDVFTGGQAPIVNKLESVSGADNFEKLTLSQTEVATTVTDEPSGQGDKVTVSIEGNGGVQENLAPTFTVKVDQKLDHDLKVTLSNGDTVTIEAGKLSAIYTAPVQGDDVYNDPSNLSLTVGSASVDGQTFENLVIDGTAANVAITDTVSEVIATLTADKPTVAEGGQVTYTVTLTNAAGLPVNNHGPLEFTLSDGTKVTVPANTATGSATIIAKDDVYTGGQPSIVNKLESVSGADNFEKLTLGKDQFTTAVTDEAGSGTPNTPANTGDVTTISISGDTSVVEGQAAHYTLALTNPAHGEVTVTLTYSGTAANGVDFTGVTTVKIPANASSVPFDISTIDDRITESTENFVVKIDSATGGNFENLEISTSNGSVGTSIIDNDAPPALDLDANNSSGATGADYKVTFTENTAGPGVSIGDTDLSITDPDSTLLTGATIVLTNRQDGDALNLGNSVNGITINANSTNGTVTLTLSGNATLADYMQQIKNITFTNNSEDPSTVPRIITVTVTDGSNYSNTATTTVNVVAVNDAPVAAPVNVTGTEDTPLILGWSTFGVSDIDSPATNLGVKITQLPGEGKLQYLDGSTWKDVAANQTFSKTDIDAGKLRFMPDANESGVDGYGPGTGDQKADYAQLQFQPTDGQTLGNTGTIKIDITPVADAPTLSVADNSVRSTGLIKEVWTGLSGLGTSGNGADSTTLKNVIDAAGTANSKGTVTNVQSDGSVTAGTASKTSGLIYLEAGKTYTFSGIGDDSLLVTIGGKNVAAITWGAGGNLNGSYTPTTSGYYTLDIYHHNQSGPGSYDVNLSVNGSTPIDLSSAGVPIYTGVPDLVNAGVTVSDLHGTNGEGYYDGYKLNTGAEGTSVKLSAITTALTDTDGSESLSLKISGMPVGSVLTDGAGHTFTVTASNGEANVTGWNLGSLTVTAPPYYNGQFNLTVTSTSTEALGGSASSTSQIPVTVYPAAYNAVTATAADDTVTGTDGNDIIVADIGGLTVVPGTNYNIAFMVDSSGSMSSSSISSAKDSLTSVFNTLKQSLGSNSGTVNIFLVDFDTQVNKSVSVNLNDSNALTQLKATLDSMSSGGGTNYEDVFKTTANWFQSADAVANTGAKNLTYFITDGKPTYYQSGESTNPTLYGSTTLDSLITTSNYQLGKAISLFPDSTHQIDISASGQVTVWTKSSNGNNGNGNGNGNGSSWSSKDFGYLHAQGDGTYEFSGRDGDGSSTDWDTTSNSTGSFALLSNLSNVEAIGLNNGVSLNDLKPYDSNQLPQTNIDPKDLANSIIGHTEATMPGHDTVSGGEGNDILFGDLVSFNGIAGEGYQAMQAFVAQQSGVEVSKVTTSNVHQYITEHYNAFDLSGAHDGNDTLLGGAGNDILFGSGGNDNLDGGKGNDILLGGTGNDTLMGGQGSDILIGGSGGDTFVWKAGDTGNDVIKDFKASEGDRIDLRDLLQGETGSTIDNFLKISTVDGVSSLQVSSAGQFNSGNAAAATPDVTIKLEGNNWSSANLHNLIAGSDPTIKIDHNNS
ncbi:retention module-containing protein [Pseudomonas monachiensis]